MNALLSLSIPTLIKTSRPCLGQVIVLVRSLLCCSWLNVLKTAWKCLARIKGIKSIRIKGESVSKVLTGTVNRNPLKTIRYINLNTTFKVKHEHEHDGPQYFKQG